MRSLSWKLIGAFLFVGLIGVIVVAIFASQLTSSEFDRLKLEQDRADFIATVTDYYQANGSLTGIQRVLHPAGNPVRNGPPGGGQPPNDGGQPPGLRFVLVDLNGQVLTMGGAFHPGVVVPASMLQQAVPVEVNGQTIAQVITLNQPPNLTPREQEFLGSINQALILATIGAGLLAILVAVLLTRMLTRPLRELTHAIRAMKQGSLKQEVPVRSKDEIGELVQAFNHMSTDLARSNLLRRQMMADIAHDLRTPLTVVTGYLEGLRDGTLRATPERFAVMHDEALQLQRLIEDLRTLSLAEAGELALTCERVALGDLFQDIARSFDYLAEQKGVELRLLAAPDLPAVELDRRRMQQVLGNLVGNALRYTPSGGQIVLSAVARPGGVEVTVQDTGAGIALDKLPYIFNRFYRVDEGHVQGDGQTGLGLAIVKSIIEAHHGAIRAESTVGQGTVMRIDLPLNLNQAAM